MLWLVIFGVAALAIGVLIGRLLPSQLIPTAYLLVGTVAFAVIALGAAREQEVQGEIGAEDQTGLAVLTLSVIWAIVILAPSVGALLGYNLRDRRRR